MQNPTAMVEFTFPISGSFAPDIILKAEDGSLPLRLSDLRGKSVLLVFQTGEWDPSQPETVAQYRRILPQESRIEIINGRVADEETEKVYALKGRNAMVLVDSEGKVSWSKIDGEDASEAVASPKGPSRREFLGVAASLAFVIAIPSTALAKTSRIPKSKISGPNAVPFTLKINGESRRLTAEPRVSLLDALREQPDLTGSKKGCDHGQCGACTVLVDGKRMNSCLMLAIAQQGKSITTIEGLASGEKLHPMQTAFLENDAFQCGFCTPGQILSAVGMMNEPCGKTDAEVRECMSGNLCRCAAYDNILTAIQSVRGHERKGLPS